jgi:hypothetical protein
MAKIGEIVNIPTGSYCNVTLDSKERIAISHEQGKEGRGGHLAVDRLRLMGFSSETVFRVGLDTEAGRALVAHLDAASPPTSGPLLRRFVASLQDCRSVDEVITRCRRFQEAQP